MARSSRMMQRKLTIESLPLRSVLILEPSGSFVPPRRLLGADFTEETADSRQMLFRRTQLAGIVLP